MNALPAPFRLPVAALAPVIFALSGCQPRTESSQPVPSPVEAKVEAPPPAAAPPPSVLKRAELLRAMQDAASAYAAGQPPKRDSLAGRRFSVRQAFGCFGPSTSTEDEGGRPRWSWGAKSQTIELSLTPEEWTGSALVTGASADSEAVEGLWLTRPWLENEGCPGVRPDPLASGPSAPSPQTMGLAAVFGPDSSRLGQRSGRAYRYVLHGEAGQPPVPPPAGYRLVVEGRLASFPDGRAISCRAASPDHQPVCVAATRLERVAFEDANGTVLSEWRPG